MKDTKKTTDQRTLDNYTEERQWVTQSIETFKRKLWETGVMTEDLSDELDRLRKYEEELHAEVLEIYSEYAATIENLRLAYRITEK